MIPEQALLRIAGVEVRIRCDDATFVPVVLGRFNGRHQALAEMLPGPVEAEVTREGTVVRVRSGGIEGTADIRRGVVATPSSLTLMDALVRVVVGARLVERGGLLLHAAAIERPAGALVAFGRSRAGKSTLAKGFGGRAISDEFVALAPGRPWRVHSTPWWRGSGPSAPLGRLVWLVRGEPPSARAVGGAELCAALWREAGRFAPGFDARLLEACASLARCGALRVAAPEGGVVEAVRSAA